MRWLLATIGCLLAGLVTGAAGRWAIAGKGGGRTRGGADVAAVASAEVGRQPADAAKAAALAEFSRGAGDGPRLSVEELLKGSGLADLERLARWLPEATADELVAVLTAPDAPVLDFSAARDAIYLRWAELDPEGAVRFARKRGDAGPAWEAWARVDPEAALAAVGKSPRSPALAHVLAAIASVDPEKARRLGETYPAAFHSATVRAALTAKTWRDDPRAAAEMAGPESIEELRETLARWVDTDPEAVLEWSRSRPGPERFEGLSALFSRWAESAPEKIAAALDDLPPGSCRNDLLREHIGRLCESDPQAALDFAARVKNGPRVSLMDMALRLVATAEPQRALEALAQVEAGDWASRGAFSGTLRTLGETMGADTMAWFGSPQGAMVREANPNAQEKVFRGWMATSRDAAMTWLAEQPSESRPADCVRAAVSLLTGDGVAEYEAARQWAVTLPEGTDRASALKEVFQQWSASDPEAAAAALENTPVPEADRARLRETIDKKKPAP